MSGTALLQCRDNVLMLVCSTFLMPYVVLITIQPESHESTSFFLISIVEYQGGLWQSSRMLRQHFGREHTTYGVKKHHRLT